LNYWTGGAQRDCKGQWTWCAGSNKVTIKESLYWAYNQPDNKAGGDDCIHMRLLQNTTGIVLSDRNCSDKYIVACEVRKKNYLQAKISAPNIKQGVPKMEKCAKPNCLDISRTKDVCKKYFVFTY
jgi:hypothetical protein